MPSAHKSNRKPLNPKKEQHLTIEDIRAIDGYENLPEAELDQVLLQLRQFAMYLYEFHSKQKHHEKH